MLSTLYECVISANAPQAQRVDVAADIGLHAVHVYESKEHKTFNMDMI